MGGTTGKDGGINTQAVLSMVGSGYYSERTAGARDVINNAAQMVLAALAETPDTPTIRFALCSLAAFSDSSLDPRASSSSPVSQ